MMRMDMMAIAMVMTVMAMSRAITYAHDISS